MATRIDVAGDGRGVAGMPCDVDDSKVVTASINTCKLVASMSIRVCIR